MHRSSGASSRCGSSRSPGRLSAPSGPDARRPAAAAALAVALLLLPAAGIAAADSDTLAEGARLETAGDAAAAARFYREWLLANPADPRADSVFFTLFKLETALPELFELSRLPGLGAKPLLALARLSEMTGRSEEARDLFRRAAGAGAGPEALVGWLTLCVSMNDGEAIRDGLGQLRAADPVWADVIEGMVSLAAGRPDPASLLLRRASASAVDPRAALAAAWGLVECAVQGGNPAAAAAARAELARRFPSSPEAGLAAGTVGRSPGPAQFAEPGESAPVKAQALPAAPTPAAEASPQRYAVQAGTFSVRENADYLAADLVKKGFAAVVRSETRDGRQVFKVFAGVDLARPAAEALAGQVSGAGFAGFVISEAR